MTALVAMVTQLISTAVGMTPEIVKLAQAAGHNVDDVLAALDQALVDGRLVVAGLRAQLKAIIDAGRSELGDDSKGG